MKKMKNKLFWLTAGGILLVLLLFVWVRQGQNVITDFRTSLIEGIDSETQTTLPSEDMSLLEQVAQSLASVELKLDQGVRVKQNGEFTFALGQNTEEDYVIPENTCQNGVRLVLKTDPLSIAQDKMPVVTVLGMNRRKNKSTFAKEVEFTKEKSFHIFHLPSVLLEDNDSVFPEYKISEARFSENIEFDVFCY